MDTAAGVLLDVAVSLVLVLVVKRLRREQMLALRARFIYCLKFQTKREHGMNFKIGLTCFAFFGSTMAHAADAPIPKNEFEQIIASPFTATNAKSGLVVNVHLKPDGSAVVRQGYNDVGTWRRDGDSGYCVRWNKRRTDESCAYFVKRDGKLGVNAASGELTYWIEPSEK